MPVAPPSYDALALDRAKELRSDMTDAESKLWSHLRAKRFSAFKFRRQQPIGPYIVDFVCQSARLIVETDGSQHADSSYDEKRTAWLNSRGYRVLRFWNSDILLRTSWMLDAVYAALMDPSPSRAEDGAGSSLSLKGKGEESCEHA